MATRIRSNPLPATKNEPEVASQISEHLKTKYDTLTQAFKTIDKDQNSQVTKKELLEFLDRNLPKGRIFDRPLAEKMFQTFDFDRNEIITVEEFIKSFLLIEEEIKRTAKECQIKYATEKENQTKWQKLLLDNKGEVLNREGFCERAAIFLEISEVQLDHPIRGANEILIRILLRDVVKDTRIISMKDTKAMIQERFEFKPTTRKDEFIFELRKVDQSLPIGLVKFNLETLLKQSEYELELLIPDDKDERVTIATIKAKITFIWSYFQLYQDLIGESDQIIVKIKNLLDKSNDYLQKLNEPLKMFQVIGEKFQLNNLYHDMTQENNGSNDRLISGKVASQSLTTDHIETFLKKTLKQSIIQWLWIIKLLLVINICLSFLTSLCRSDFPNILAPILILGILFTNFGKNEAKNLLFFSQLTLATIVYDILWFYFSSSAYLRGTDQYTGAKEDSLKFFVLFCSLVILVIKIFLCIALWIKKSKVEQGLADDPALLANAEKSKNTAAKV